MNTTGCPEGCSCSPGCTARHTEEKMEEEISAGPYLIASGIAIVILSIVFKWLF
jgi:hypothetical protein